MRIAVFDYIVAPRNPPGACDIEVLAALRSEHRLTVVTSELSVPESTAQAVETRLLRTIRRPALASFLGYLLGALRVARRLRGEREPFDLVQATDCSLPTADIAYAHFCHRCYLREVWPHVRGGLSLRRAYARLSHELRAAIERRLVRRARVVVVPSQGLARDIARTYPGTREKITVIRNTVDAVRFARPPAFDRVRIRKGTGTDERDVVFVFVALGHFERKGLPSLVAALSELRGGSEPVRLWVVGGERGLVQAYVARAHRLGVGDMVHFVGRAIDVRPYLWAADAFVSPSRYEAFSLGLLEAAAAGLPLLATRVSGSEELLVDGVNGFEMTDDPSGVAGALRRFLVLEPSERAAMGAHARAAVEPLDLDRFADAWRSLYASLSPQPK